MDQYHIGPAGGYGGQPFDNYNIPEGARLTAIHIYTGWVINALKFDYVAADGTPGERPTVGGLGGEHRIFYLDEDEYLTGISGRAGWYIDSIQFHTNKRQSPLFGGVGGDRDFTFEAPAGHEICGLFGRAAWYIDALGVKARRHVERAQAGADDGDDETQSWLSLAGEGEPLPASVIVRRQLIDSNEALTELEDAALAEAIAGFGGDNVEEGTIDAAIYSQVSDDVSGRQMAVVLAVASEPSRAETVGDEPDEVAVMITDTVESEDELPMLEEEAVEAAIETLLGDLGEEADEVEVTIFTGMNEDEVGEQYAAVVAIATRLSAPVQMATRAPEGIGVSERTPQPKELQLVEGIGPKIADLLIENDIYDLADLALATEERLRTILSGAGKRFRLADPTTWPDQAALGATGQWDALTELQTRLKGGRR